MKNVTIVVGTVGQSIMRSEDSGQTWARIGPRRGFAYEASVRTIAMHPTDHKNIFSGTGRGLYRSEDAGANWRYVDSALNPYYIWALAIDPTNPDVMFAGTGTPTPAMIFRSRDGGRRWEQPPVAIAATRDAGAAPAGARRGTREKCKRGLRGTTGEKKTIPAPSRSIRETRKESSWASATSRRDPRARSPRAKISAKAGSSCRCPPSRIPPCGPSAPTPTIPRPSSPRVATAISTGATTVAPRG